MPAAAFAHLARRSAWTRLTLSLLRCWELDLTPVPARVRRAMER